MLAILALMCIFFMLIIDLCFEVAVIFLPIKKTSTDHSACLKIHPPATSGSFSGGVRWYRLVKLREVWLTFLHKGLHGFHHLG